jgi:ubiquinone/menaquinone biosynthesis C-methylase UbiE
MTGLIDRVSAGVCRRAFSSPEALAYEICVAPAVCEAVAHDVVRRMPSGLVLDVGAGGGRLAEVLCGARRDVVAVDPSRSQARRVTRRRAEGGGLRSVCASAGELPFRSGSFDGVVSCCALKHWPDPIAGLIECARVIGPGAPILVIEVDGDASESDFREFATSTRMPVGMRGAYTRFAMRTVVSVAPTRAEFQKYLIGANLNVQSLDRLVGTPFLLASSTA